MKNTIKGGKADKMSVEDIAKKFNVSVDKIKAQLEKGIEIEKEHTSDKEKATEIAMDHISEFPDYYDRIEKMEKEADKRWKINENNFVVDDMTIIRFIKALEEAKIIKNGSHENTKLIETIRDIISMSADEFKTYIIKHPNHTVKMIRTEFNDWKQTEINENSKLLIKNLIRKRLNS